MTTLVQATAICPLCYFSRLLTSLPAPSYSCALKFIPNLGHGGSLLKHTSLLSLLCSEPFSGFILTESEIQKPYQSLKCWLLVTSLNVLVRSRCYNKISQTPWLITTEIYFTQFWRLGSARSRPQCGRAVVRALFLVHSQCLLSVSLYGGKWVESSLRSLSYDANPMHEIYPHSLSTSQRPHLLTQSSLGVRIPTHEFGGHKHANQSSHLLAF